MTREQKKEKRREARKRNNTKALMKSTEDLAEDLDMEEELPSDSVGEIVEKHYISESDLVSSYTGATSWEDMDAEKIAREEAQQVRDVSYSAQDLVSNIIYSQMPPEDKASAIKKVGDGLGKRLKTVTKMEKAVDMDLLELQTILARDSRRTGFMEKMGNWLSATQMNKESFPHVDDKAQTRYSIKQIIKALDGENENKESYRQAIPMVKEAAKKFGVGTDGSIIIEKDKAGSWRAVMFPTNNFKDRDGEIITEAAHLEYVEWINKNMDCAPVSMIWHQQDTARTHPFDFIGYENGFMVASLPLTDGEAAALMKMQIQTDIGLSVGGIAVHDPMNDKVITKYRMFEVSDMPLERAANPYTEIELISKEAQMDLKSYLSGFISDPERVDKIIEKTALSQAELRKAGVKEKETATPEAPTAPTTTVNTVAPALDMKEVIEALKKEIDLDGLNEYLSHVAEEAEKVPVLEQLIKELSTSNAEKLAEMINPPAQKMLVWQKERKSQKPENILDPNKEEDKKLSKSAPELGWLSAATNTHPVAAQS